MSTESRADDAPVEPNPSDAVAHALEIVRTHTERRFEFWVEPEELSDFRML